MRKVLSRLLVIGLVGLFVSGQVFVGLPSTALAATKLPVYSPEVIGDRFRNEVATPDKIDLSGGLPEDESGGGQDGGVGTLSVGEQKIFLVLNDYTGQYQLTYYTLRGVGTYGEVWVQNSLAYPAGDPRPAPVVTDEQVNYLVEQFDTVIYPEESEFFATPDSLTGANAYLPGLVGLPQDYYVSSDGIERVVILISNVRDENYYDPTYPLYIAGFFSPAYEVYFDRNVMTIDSYDWGNRVGPNTSPWRPDDGTANDRPYLYEGTFAHEYQHLLHYDMDPAEENWINEGMSDFASYITGYSDPNTDSHIASYLNHPYNSLVNWGDQGDLEILADYGAAYLFQLYLNQNYGSALIQALAHNQLTGIASVNDTLESEGIDATFEDIYRSWVEAILINGGKRNGKYVIDDLSLRVALDGEGDFGPAALPWGPAYFQIPTDQRIDSLTIQGISFLPNPWTVADDPLSPGNSVLYSGAGDLLSNFLILPVDLTGTTGASLQFKTLYDIEATWDFGFVQVSADGGQTWQSLANADTISEYDPAAHPDIIANLPGLTGYSGGWVDETFDLSAYDGQSILLAFRYMTDWATNGNGELANPGWYIDDVNVANFTSDGTSLEPFSGIDEVRDQFVQYMISFVGKNGKGKGAQPRVLDLKMQTFDEAQQIELKKFLRDSSLGEITMIVSQAATQGSSVPAPFSYTVGYHHDVPKPRAKHAGPDGGWEQWHFRWMEGHGPGK